MTPLWTLDVRRLPWCGLVMAALATLTAGCAMLKSDEHLVAFTAPLNGANEVPPVTTPAVGRVDAVLDTQTRLFRWKASLNALSGMPTAAHFHGPAVAGTNAGVALGWSPPLSIRYEGRATLTTQQVNDLMAGRWYANVHTAAHPAGEVRGQMTVVRR